MGCLTPTVNFHIFMDNYFISFRLLTHIGVNNIRATRVLNKNRLHIIRDKHMQKSIKQKSIVTLTVFGWNNSSAIYIASSESCETNTFVRCWNKVEKKYIQE